MYYVIRLTKDNEDIAYKSVSKEDADNFMIDCLKERPTNMRDIITYFVEKRIK